MSRSEEQLDTRKMLDTVPVIPKQMDRVQAHLVLSRTSARSQARAPMAAVHPYRPRTNTIKELSQLSSSVQGIADRVRVLKSKCSTSGTHFPSAKMLHQAAELSTVSNINTTDGFAVFFREEEEVWT